MIISNYSTARAREDVIVETLTYMFNLMQYLANPESRVEAFLPKPPEEATHKHIISTM